MAPPLNLQTLSDLRISCTAVAKPTVADDAARISFGTTCMDTPLGGGLTRPALHEVFATCGADAATATGFAVAVAIRAAEDRPVVWVRQDFSSAETGSIYPPGLKELGLDPTRLILVRARNAVDVLKAGAEAARCSSLAMVLIEPWGAHRVIDLTASRRLSLAAQASKTPTLLLQTAAEPVASAAETRWQISALPSRALEANAPGYPAFKVKLLRHRGGLDAQEWSVEWNRDKRHFQERIQHDRTADIRPAIPRPLVSVSADRQTATGAYVPLRRTG